MRLIYPKIDITLPDYAETIRLCASASALCYNKQISKEDDLEGLENYVKARLAAKHDSIAEHAHISVEFTCDRGITHEIVRHRLCSFTQSSTRFIDLCSEINQNNATYIIPSWCKDIKPGIYDIPTKWATQGETIWFNQMLQAEINYRQLRQINWTPEMARSILPNSLAAKIRVTANIREWRHILNLRARGITGRPHPQMLQLMMPLCYILSTAMPVFFEPCNMTGADIEKYSIEEVQMSANTDRLPTYAIREE